MLLYSLLLLAVPCCAPSPVSYLSLVSNLTLGVTELDDSEDEYDSNDDEEAQDIKPRDSIMTELPGDATTGGATSQLLPITSYPTNSNPYPCVHGQPYPNPHPYSYPCPRASP
jgi:hypothetical protein